MSRADRIIGLLRSLAIYHAIPLRQRRLRRLYAQLVSPGDLVFDLGAHAGNRTRALAAMGCRVVASSLSLTSRDCCARSFAGRQVWR